MVAGESRVSNVFWVFYIAFDRLGNSVIITRRALRVTKVLTAHLGVAGRRPTPILFRNLRRVL